MSKNRLPENSATQAKARSLHLADYLAILREHRWIALVPFLLILGGAIALTLLATPQYKADATIHIEKESGRGSLIGELELFDSGSKVDAEIEIMRSRAIASFAAKTIAVEQGLGAFFMERNAHRPYEVMMRAFQGPKPSCSVEFFTEPLADGRGATQYRFVFLDKQGGEKFGVEVQKVVGRRFGEDITREKHNITSGKRFRAFGHPFHLTVAGDPVGREYKVVLRSEAAVANWLRAQTTVAQLGRKTGVVSLAVRAESPELAAAASKALAESFAAYKHRKRRGDAGAAAEFLAGRVDSTGGKLAKAEAELDRFRTKNSVMLLSERAKSVIEQLAALEREQAELELRAEQSQRAIKDLSNRALPTADLVSYVGPGDAIGAALGQSIHEIETSRGALLKNITERHDDVKALDMRLSATRDRLQTHLLRHATSAEATQDRRAARLTEDMNRLMEEERRLPAQERELARITREVESLLTVSAFLQEKKHEAEIMQESTLSRVNIIDSPVPPKQRETPNLLVNLLIGAFLALVAAVGTAFFAEYLDRSIKTPEDLEEATGLPLYAALPSFKSIKSRDTRKLKSQMVTIEKPHSVLAEGYRSLRANVKFADFESPVRSFAITSAVLGEGKTTTTLNLAVVLAEGGSRVIVVDADMRRPATHSHLGGDLKPGLSEVLRGDLSWRQAVRPVKDTENLSAIHAGAKPDNPGALLDSDRFRTLLAELKEEYDYVVFDVPPVLAVSDAAAFFRSLDAVFLLVQWRRCPIDVVLAARDQIVRLGATARGVIFNGFDARKAGRRGYGRYGYYGYYGGYGGYGYAENPAAKRGQSTPKVKSGK